ncbi:MAG: glycerol-3-phosphate dehydrogenase [Candidatus Omnitrophica bacterium CG1_02_44_16]|nr:MAG: glycerol-3-phosphate dehydrogenase [Candidatus Omnitrophica bacterium CG1_02_44_16]PIZ83475.1 MAG: glycerol-3-phosphate dehydrogenase [Candidatus Omnitrophica bacterium CG_4_10_14_0_2_um_filter_44_9]
MSCFKRISILGDGGWGTTLAILLYNKGMNITLWSVFDDYAKILDESRHNINFLKGIKIPRGIRITSDLKEALSCDLVVLAVPSLYLRQVLLKGKKYYLKSAPVVSVVKGIENGTLFRMSEVVKELWHSPGVAVLSGPTIALELARKIPTAAVVASGNKRLMLALQDLFMTPFFRIYANPDVIGVEVGGSIKNIIAIACGVSDGLKFGTNTKAAILSRGLAEIARLGVRMGGKKETFFGITGLGDLVTTCFNPLSRNHFVGQKIGEGHPLSKVIAKMKMVAEGVSTTKSAYMLGKKLHVDLPITNEIYNVLFKRRPSLIAVKRLMRREKKAEQI